jgi:sugar lactone lactonase YvrE
MRFAAAFLVASGALLAATAPTSSHLDFRADARAAYERKDYAAAHTATLAALARRPDSPRYLYNLAACSALLGDAPGAIAWLERLADLGVSLPAERDPDFAPLQGTPPFRRALERLAANRAPRGEAGVLAELPGRAGIVEGIAFRPATGDLFLGDVHLRGIWRRDRGGQVTRFTADDEELLGVFGLALDEARGSLWAAMSAVPEMTGYTRELQGAAALAEFDLRNGEVRRIVPVPDDGREHGLGDLLVTPEGVVLATDFKAPTIWKLSPGAEEFEKFAESPRFANLQGIVLRQRTVIVADYAHGLFAIDVATGTMIALAPPKDATLLGLDGLTLAADGLVATQNGVDPARVVKIGLSPDLNTVTGVTVLAAALPHLQDLALITLMEDRPTFVTGAGWEGFDASKALAPASHTVRVMQVALP